MTKVNKKAKETTETTPNELDTVKAVVVIETPAVVLKVGLDYGKLKNIDKQLNPSQIEQIETLKSISARIRYLDSENFTTGNIARMLGKRYQHVRNVLTTPLKRKDVSLDAETKTKEKIAQVKGK